MSLTMAEANDLIAGIPTGTLAEKEAAKALLESIFSQLNVTGHGTTTVFYSGRFPDNTSPGDIAKAMAQNDSTLRIVTDTEAGRFLNTDLNGNTVLRGKLLDIFGDIEVAENYLDSAAWG